MDPTAVWAAVVTAMANIPEVQVAPCNVLRCVPGCAAAVAAPDHQIGQTHGCLVGMVVSWGYFG